MNKAVISMFEETKIRNHICQMVYEKGLFEVEGYYPVLENSTNREVGRFVCVYGNKVAVKFLAWLTNIHLYKNAKEVTIDY